MKSRLVLFATWLNADPRRKRLVLFLTLTALAMASSPGGIALAEDATGGSG